MTVTTYFVIFITCNTPSPSSCFSRVNTWLIVEWLPVADYSANIAYSHWTILYTGRHTSDVSIWEESIPPPVVGMPWVLVFGLGEVFLLLLSFSLMWDGFFLQKPHAVNTSYGTLGTQPKDFYTTRTSWEPNTRQAANGTANIWAQKILFLFIKTTYCLLPRRKAMRWANQRGKKRRRYTYLICKSFNPSRLLDLPKSNQRPRTKGYHPYHYLDICLPSCQWENNTYAFSAGEEKNRHRDCIIILWNDENDIIWGRLQTFKNNDDNHNDCTENLDCPAPTKECYPMMY